MPGFFVQRDALYREAKMWAYEPPAGRAVDDTRGNILAGDVEGWSMAEVAGSSAGALEAIAMTSQELSLAALETGLLDTYEALRRKAIRLLTEGKENFESVSATLIEISKEYGQADEAADDDLRRRWQPVPRDGG